MKFFHLLLAASTISTASIAQTTTITKSSYNTGPYVRLGIGYDFAHAGQTSIIGLVFNGSSNSASTYTASIKRGSFGTGLALNLAGGYMISRHIGLELGVDAIVAPKKYEATNSYSSSGAPDVRNYKTYAKHPIYIVPAVVLTTGGTGVNLYTRLGLALPVSDKVIIDEQYTASSGTLYHYEFELTNRFSVAMKGALGVSIPVSDAIVFWAEVNGISRNAYTKKLELTTYTKDGADMLGSQTTSQKVTEYEFDLDASTGSAGPGTPTRSLTSSVPFSNIGVMIGVRFNL